MLRHNLAALLVLAAIRSVYGVEIPGDPNPVKTVKKRILEIREGGGFHISPISINYLVAVLYESGYLIFRDTAVPVGFSSITLDRKQIEELIGDLRHNPSALKMPSGLKCGVPAMDASDITMTFSDAGLSTTLSCRDTFEIDSSTRVVPAAFLTLYRKIMIGQFPGAKPWVPNGVLFEAAPNPPQMRSPEIHWVWPKDLPPLDRKPVGISANAISEIYLMGISSESMISYRDLTEAIRQSAVSPFVEFNHKPWRVYSYLVLPDESLTAIAAALEERIRRNYAR